MRIAITGGTGFIGKHLAERLILEGHDVVLLARSKDAGSEARGTQSPTFVASDLSDQDMLRCAFLGCHAAPVWFHYMLAGFWELTMKVPLVARAQVRILSEGVLEPALPCDPLPIDLAPTRRFTDDQISKGLPAPGSFTFRDLRCCA